MNESSVSSMNPPTAPSWSAEEEANRLMDDVFSDIDSLLTGKQPSVKFQSPPASEYSSLQSVVAPPMDFAGIPMVTTEQIMGDSAEIIIKRGWGYYTERLFFISSCASLVGVVLWMAVGDRLKAPYFLTQPVPVTEVTATPTTAESVFANYVQRALDSIDRQQAPQPIPVAPQAGVALTPEQNANGQNPQVIERIYIPVYPPEISANGTKPIPQTSTVAKPKPAAPQTFNSLPQPKAVNNSASTPLIPPPPPLSAVPSLPSPPAASKDLYTLAGVLSGDVPTVLFKINGVTQRFKVGEEVGSSNWKIISAQDTQVLLGQGGQTRTIYIGEVFSGN